MIEADRQALAEFLSGLTAEEWNGQSLCSDWSVADVAAHMLVIPTVSKGSTLINFLTSGFNLDTFSAKMVDRIRSDNSNEQMAAAMGDAASSQRVPLGLKPMGVLAETLVHSGDISEGVGRPLAFPAEHYAAGLEYLKDVQPALGTRERIAGLKITATDADWSHGDGPEVQGPAQYLTLAITGRKSALDHLSGDGVDTLRAR